MYQLVFKGQCSAGVEVAAARANVARVFKVNDAQLDRLFSGERVVIRNKLDAEAAGKYQSALAQQGIVVHIEAMAPPAAEPVPAGRTAAQSGPEVEPGQRLLVAGDRVDEVLAGSSLSLGRPGETLGVAREVVEPTFENLDSWSLAAAGELLVEASELPPVAVPDVSHLDLLPPGQRD